MTTTIKPYGDKDPYASISLIAHTQLDIDDNFDIDQMPVLAARVSHAGDTKTGQDPEADLKLMKYLAKHKHMSVFEHMSVTFKVVIPLAMRSEWHRHRTQSFNEISMRYTDDPVGKFYVPEKFREQATRNKQSSAGDLPEHLQWKADAVMRNAYNACIESYNTLIDLGVCREQARMVVPVGNYTEFYATANLRNWYGFWVLRSAPEAQKEIRVYANAIDNMLSEIFPNSWKALKNT